MYKKGNSFREVVCRKGVINIMLRNTSYYMKFGYHKIELFWFLTRKKPTDSHSYLLDFVTKYLVKRNNFTRPFHTINVIKEQ